MRTVSRILVVFAVALVAACDPLFVLEGRVVDSAGRPAAGMTVRLSCDGVTQYTVVTDANGSYSAKEVGVYPDTCFVQVARDGFVVMQLPVMAVCRKKDGEHGCLTVHADIELPSP